MERAIHKIANEKRADERAGRSDPEDCPQERADETMGKSWVKQIDSSSPEECPEERAVHSSHNQEYFIESHIVEAGTSSEL